MTYPIMKTGKRPIDDVAMANPGIIYEPNHQEFVDEADWAAFHGDTEDGYQVLAHITYLTRPVTAWGVTIAVGPKNGPAMVALRGEGTYTNALAHLQRALERLKAVRGAPRMLN